MSQGSKRHPDERADDLTALDDQSELAAQIQHYFASNSDAMDSAEGIAQFWLHQNPRVVERCLFDLESQGLLQRRTIAGTDLFSLRKNSETSRTPSDPFATPRSESHGRILIADDDPSVRRFMADALSSGGHSTVVAEDGEQALEILRTNSFDLVLTDVVMPRGSGIEILKTIKRQSPSTEVVVVTAHATLETAMEALRHGAYDFIRKPISDIENLYRIVRRALEKGRLSTENRLLVEKLQVRNRELKETVTSLAAVNEIGKVTSGLLDLGKLYDTLVRLIAQHLQVRRVSVLVSDTDSETMELVASVGITDSEALSQRMRVGEGIAGHVAATGSPALITDIDRSIFKSLRTGARYKTASCLVVPLTIGSAPGRPAACAGAISVTDRFSGEPFSEQDLDFLDTLAGQVGLAIQNARHVKAIEDGYLGTLIAVIQNAEDLQPETQGHSARVMRLAVSAGRAMGLSEGRLETLFRAAALHEAGRLFPGAGERPGADGASATYGAWDDAAASATGRILESIASFEAVRQVIRLSPLRSSPGSQLPLRVTSTVPLESRILAACEDYVQLAPVRGLTPEIARAALERMRRLAEWRNDPGVLSALERVSEEEALT